MDTLPPLERANFSDVQLPGNDEFNAAHAVWGHTIEQVKARDIEWAAKLAAERSRIYNLFLTTPWEDEDDSVIANAIKIDRFELMRLVRDGAGGAA